jgi:hypothetical protein
MSAVADFSPTVKTWAWEVAKGNAKSPAMRADLYVSAIEAPQI